MALGLLALSAMAAEPVKPIQAASEYDYPPFAIVSKDNQADGFSVELMRAALHALGRDVQFRVGPWHEIKDDLAEGRIQALPLVARNKEREKIFDFSTPYLYMHGAIVVRKGDARIRSAGDLQGRTVVVMKADIGEEYVHQHHLSDKVVTTETLEDGLRQLADGKVDAMVVQRLSGEKLIRSLGLDNLEMAGPPLEHYQEFCFAVRKGDSELLSLLNEGLAIIIVDGTRDRLHEKWIAPTRDEYLAQIRNIVAAALGTLLLAGLVAYLWQKSLRAQVRIRTAELRESEDQLRQAGQRLGFLIGSSPVVIYSCKASGNYAITYVSENVRQQFGYAPDQFMDDPDFRANHIHPDDRERVFAELPRFSRHSHHAQEYRYRHKDGSYRWIRDERNLVMDSEGNSETFVGSWIDITERKLAEEEARISALKPVAVREFARCPDDTGSAVLAVYRGKSSDPEIIRCSERGRIHRARPLAGFAATAAGWTSLR